MRPSLHNSFLTTLFSPLTPSFLNFSQFSDRPQRHLLSFDFFCLLSPSLLDFIPFLPSFRSALLLSSLVPPVIYHELLPFFVLFIPPSLTLLCFLFPSRLTYHLIPFVLNFFLTAFTFLLFFFPTYFFISSNSFFFLAFLPSFSLYHFIPSFLFFLNEILPCLIILFTVVSLMLLSFYYYFLFFLSSLLYSLFICFFPPPTPLSFFPQPNRPFSIVPIYIPLF